jgi:hypothetical protein
MNTVKIVKVISLLIIAVTNFVYTAEQSNPKYTGFSGNIIYNRDTCTDSGGVIIYYYFGSMRWLNKSLKALIY